jgi:hypothetical protein
MFTNAGMKPVQNIFLAINLRRRFVWPYPKMFEVSGSKRPEEVGPIRITYMFEMVEMVVRNYFKKKPSTGPGVFARFRRAFRRPVDGHCFEGSADDKLERDDEAFSY